MLKSSLSKTRLHIRQPCRCNHPFLHYRLEPKCSRLHWLDQTSLNPKFGHLQSRQGIPTSALYRPRNIPLIRLQHLARFLVTLLHSHFLGYLQYLRNLVSRLTYPGQHHCIHEVISAILQSLRVWNRQWYQQLWLANREVRFAL